MITLCWAAKGGSGTTVLVASLALSCQEPTLLIDLAGDVPTVLGVPEPSGPGIHDWAASTAGVDRLTTLELDVGPSTRLVPAGAGGDAGPARWQLLAEHLRAERRRVIIDAGTGEPPGSLLRVCDGAWLVTRPCYLALRAAVHQVARPTGLVVVDEPGRALREADIESALGAPVVATVLVDPAVARAVDAGLVVSRLPAAYRRRLKAAS